jgi:hypothetical protein
MGRETQNKGKTVITVSRTIKHFLPITFLYFSKKKYLYVDIYNSMWEFDSHSLSSAI